MGGVSAHNLDATVHVSAFQDTGVGKVFALQGV